MLRKTSGLPWSNPNGAPESCGDLRPLFRGRPEFLLESHRQCSLSCSDLCDPRPVGDSALDILCELEDHPVDDAGGYGHATHAPEGSHLLVRSGPKSA